MTGRRLGLFFFSCLFLVETLVNQGVHLDPFQWFLLALSASMIGRACAYLSILEWFRAPFVKVVPHSSGAGEDNHPRWTTGVASALAELICCPVCAGTWGAVLLLTLYKVAPAWGETLLYTLAAASAAWFVSYLTQLVEWLTHLVRELVGAVQRWTKSQ